MHAFVLRDIGLQAGGGGQPRWGRLFGVGWERGTSEALRAYTCREVATDHVGVDSTCQQRGQEEGGCVLASYVRVLLS